MKKYLAGVLSIAFLAAFSWAQGARELYDVKKCQEELEIMKGILGTTLSFVAQNMKTTATTTPKVVKGDAVRGNYIYGYGSLRFSNIGAYYLVGQGAVFSIPSSNFMLGNLYFDEDQIQALTYEALRISEKATSLAQQAPKAAVAPGTPPPPPPPPAPQSQDEMRKKLTEQLEKARKSRVDMAANREKALQALSETKVYLIEALANYGDSLTTVKPNEYINIIFSADGDFGSGARREIISVQKSAISDYKAGRLTLDAFKQKVLQYQQ